MVNAARRLHSLVQTLHKDLATKLVNAWFLALVLPVCSLLLSLLLFHAVQPAIFVLFFGAVSVAAWRGGWGPGLVAATESAGLANVFLVAAQGIPLDAHALLRTMLFFLTSGLICFVGDQQLRTQRLLQKTHADLLAEHERLRIALAAGKAFAWHHDAKTHHLTYSGNPGVLEALGSPINSSDWWSVIHPEDHERVQTLFKSALEYGHPYQTEYRVLVGGHVHWLLTHAEAIADERGSVSGVVGVTIDMTKEKHIQTALVRSERLAVAGRLAATVAHEIRNPLETIVNAIYLLKSQRSLSSEHAELLQAVETEVERISVIVRNTLTQHRDTGRASRFNVAEVVKSVLHVYEKKVSLRSISVKRSRWSANATINGYVGEIRQVITNLMSNAVDAVSDGGTICVRVRRRPDGSVVLCVADNGCGIPQTVRQSIFEPFFTTKQDTGTGLGLWVTQQLVQSTGGKIRYRSATSGIRRGTTLAVFLPNAAATHAGSMRESQAAG